MPTRRAWLLLLLAFALRLCSQGWDAGLGNTPHPDERQVGYVSERLEGWFDDPEFYAYGSLHFQVVRVATAVLGLDRDNRGLVLGGRVLSLGAVMLAIALGWWMARKAWGERTADLYLLLAAWIPLDIQQSHFATVEAHHTMWIVVALAGCFWLGMKASRGAAVVAGAAVGASLAVKVASLGLVLPLAAALFIASRSRAWLRVLELAGSAATAALVAYWLSQPWAFAEGRLPIALLVVAFSTVVLARVAQSTRRVSAAAAAAAAALLLLLAAYALAAAASLDGEGSAVSRFVGPHLNPAYLAGVGEQVAMVMCEADLAYVRVYRGTIPFLYSAQELLRWGIGPLLLAAVAGVGWGCWWLLRSLGRRLTGRWTPATVLLAVVVAWLVPMTIRLGTVHVKYLRYWEPLVVPATMVAAWALLRLERRWRRPAVLVMASATVLWGVTYLWAFASPHPHRTASEWLGAMLADDHVVAFEHWDETLSLPGAARAELPSYDLPDDDAKIARWCESLASADWVVLTSNRVRRTVLANGDRFPRTGRLYRLLLAGETGFEPVGRAERGPRLFGLLRPVQLADESFVNYDFPRVVILRRFAPVDAVALAERTLRPLPYLEQLDAVQLDRRFVAPLPALRPSPTAVGQAVDVLLWLLVFAALAGGTWALLLPVVRGWPDVGLGLSIVTGWLVPAWLLWFGSEVGFWSVSAASATGILLAVAAAGGIVAARRRRLIRRLWQQRQRAILAVLVVAGTVFLLFAAIRASNPAIFWGEKPMDFSFLNAFLRADSWPTGEPWMAGMPLHYYYFGEVLAAFPILVAGSDPAVGYNLMAATIPAVGAAVLAALGLAMARSVSLLAATLLPLVVLLTGNLGWLLRDNLELARQGRWFDLWWATSRVIPGFAIDEYPLWTALFADLHGHFIALPVLLAALVWGWLTVQRRRGWLPAALMCGVAAAVLVATNPWDVFVLTGALGLGTLVAAARPGAGLLRLVVAAGVSVLASLPFLLELAAGIGAGAGGRLFHLTDADFAPAWAVVVHFGPFLVPLAVLALVQVGRTRSWLFAVPVAAGVALLGLSFGSSAAALALAATVLFGTVAARSVEPVPRVMWTLAALGMAAVAACERLTLIDRMNTLFKIYNGVWVLLALALAVHLLRAPSPRRYALLATWLPLQLAGMLNLPLGVFQGWREPRISSPRPTLDGQAFLAEADPQTLFLVRALQGMAQPDDVVAEAAKTAYSAYTRIAMHTGQTTVVGWPWHLQQRGQSRAEVDARYRDLETLYGGVDPVDRRAVLDRYRVRWVVLADLERTTYGIGGEGSLDGVPGLVEVVAGNGALLYRVEPSPPVRLPAPTARSRVMPAAVSVIGSVPIVGGTVVRALTVDDNGGVAVLRDGTLLGLDPIGRAESVVSDTPCSVASVARVAGGDVVGCRDGGIWRRNDEGWRQLGVVSGTANLTAGDDLWALGEGGLWRHRGGVRWSQVDERPLVAAAAVGPTVAVSDGEQVSIRTGADQRTVGPVAGAVRWLAWQDRVLWALTASGLYRSGGGVLPWRQALSELEGVSAIAGGGGRLWLVLDDGLLVQHAAQRCTPPWQGPEEGGDLAQPRDIAASGAGWFVVADTRNHRLCWYTLQGVCLDRYGSEGGLPGQFHEPSGLALAPDGTLAVADTWNGRVQLLRPGGSLQIVGDRLYGPRDVLWTPDGGLLVADTGNWSLLRFSPPGWQREELHRFDAPVVGLAWSDGLVAAAVPVAGQVVLVDPVTGEEMRRLDMPGWQSGDQQEGYLAVLPGGGVLASAPAVGEIWLLEPSGATPPRRVAEGLPGVTGFAVLRDGRVIASQTWASALVRLQIER
jgi:YYY domain-containing protein